MKTWIAESTPEQPTISRNITPQWSDTLYRKMNVKSYIPIQIPTGGIYTYLQGFDVCLTPVIVQRTQMNINIYLN